MNSYERISLALKGQKPDRVPAASFMTGVTVESMNICGHGWPEAHNDAEKMAELAAAAHLHCGIETVKLPFDMAVEAEALGGDIDFGTADTLPQVRTHLFDEPEELRFSRDLLNRGRMPLVLKAIGVAKERYGPGAFIVSSVVGPFTLGGKLFGFDNFFEWLLLEPDKMREAMARLTELCVIYAEAQAGAGADAVQIGEASSSGDLISSDSYRDFIAPYHKDLCSAIKIPTVVHICGNIAGHLPYIKTTGVSGLSFDEKTGAANVREALGGAVAMIGYVDTLGVLLNSTPELVYKKSRECMEAGVDILNAGCAWPANVKNKNIEAMVRAARGEPL